MFGDCLHLEPNRHELIPDGPWVRKVRELVHNDRIFVYRHRETHNFVVCEWLDKPAIYGQGLATATELFHVDDAPDHSPTNMPPMPTVVHRCRPMAEMFQTQRDKVKTKTYEQAANEAESNQLRLEAARFLDSHGMEEAAVSHRQGCEPFVGEGQSAGMLEVVTEELNTLAASKVYSTGVVGEKRAKHKM